MDRKSVNRGRQLRFTREYRGYTQSKLCNGLSYDFVAWLGEKIASTRLVENPKGFSEVELKKQ